MNSLDYQNRAHEAEENAWSATTDDLRARWLNLAQAWLWLAQQTPMPTPIGPPIAHNLARN